MRKTLLMLAPVVFLIGCFSSENKFDIEDAQETVIALGSELKTEVECLVGEIKAKLELGNENALEKITNQVNHKLKCYKD